MVAPGNSSQGLCSKRRLAYTQVRDHLPKGRRAWTTGASCWQNQVRLPCGRESQFTEEVLAPLHTITCPLSGAQFTQPHACLSSAEIHSGKSPCPLANGEAGSTTAGLQASDCSHAPRSWLPGISSILHPQHKEISPGIQPPACQTEREPLSSAPPRGSV